VNLRVHRNVASTKARRHEAVTKTSHITFLDTDEHGLMRIPRIHRTVALMSHRIHRFLNHEGRKDRQRFHEASRLLKVALLFWVAPGSSISHGSGA